MIGETNREETEKRAPLLAWPRTDQPRFQHFVGVGSAMPYQDRAPPGCGDVKNGWLIYCFGFGSQGSGSPIDGMQKGT